MNYSVHAIMYGYFYLVSTRPLGLTGTNGLATLQVSFVIITERDQGLAQVDPRLAHHGGSDLPDDRGHLHLHRLLVLPQG
jgi:hypothetical protein